MLTQQTVTHLRTLRLDGMARAFKEQLTQPVATGLAFEDRFGLLVDRELAWRDTRRLERLLKQAKLKYPEACIEDLDTRSARGLDPRQLASLASADWIRSGHNVLITGATGLGKTWLACALGQAACRQGFAVFYTRFGRLLEELRIAHGDGSFSRRLQQLARTDLLILDPAPARIASLIGTLTATASAGRAGSSAPLQNRCCLADRAAWKDYHVVTVGFVKTFPVTGPGRVLSSGRASPRSGDNRIADTGADWRDCSKWVVGTVAKGGYRRRSPRVDRRAVRPLLMM